MKDMPRFFYPTHAACVEINHTDPVIHYVFDVIKTATIIVKTGPVTTELSVGYVDERVHALTPYLFKGHVVSVKQTTGTSFRELHVPLELMETVNEMKRLTVTSEEETKQIIDSLMFGASIVDTPYEH